MALTKNKKLAAQIAAYQASHPGTSHTAATFAVRAQQATTLAPGRRVGDPDDLDDRELGIAALLADATAQQRAFAESHWRPTSPDQPCRCSGDGKGGPCSHGQPCDADEEPCGGVWIHVDRFPGSLWGLTLWHDQYQCSACGAIGEANVTLPDVPWGEQAGDGPTVVYDDVRHPNFTPEFWAEEDFEDEPEERNCDCGASHEYHCVC